MVRSVLIFGRIIIELGPLLFPPAYLGHGRIVEEVKHPVSGDPYAAVRALQLVEVGHAPEDRRYETAELDAQDLVHGELAPEFHELAQRLVAERLRLLAIQHGEDTFGDSLSLLHGGLGVGRNGIAVQVDSGSAVAYAPHVVVALHTLVAVYRQALALVVRKRYIVELPTCAGASGPDHVLRRDLASVGEDHPVRLDLPGLDVVDDLYSEIVQSHLGHPAQGGV